MVREMKMICVCAVVGQQQPVRKQASLIRRAIGYTAIVLPLAAPIAPTKPPPPGATKRTAALLVAE